MTIASVFIGSVFWFSSAFVFGYAPEGRTSRQVIEQGRSGGKPSSIKNGKDAEESLGNLHEQIVIALTSEDTVAARKLLRTALKQMRRSNLRLSDDDRAEWYMLETRVEFAANRFSSGALAAMKLVILLPEHKRVAEALMWAGRAYEELDRPSKAIGLYEECLTKKHIDPVTKINARESIDRLRRKTAAQ